MAVKASAHITLNSVVDIEATYRYYLLQSSTLGRPNVPTVNPPGGLWDDSEPVYNSGSTSSLYYVDLTVFSDGSFHYAPVGLSTSYESAKEAYNKANNAQDLADSVNDKFDNIEFGTKNLIRNSTNLKFADYYFTKAAEKLTIIYDGDCNLIMISPSTEATDDGLGHVTIESNAITSVSDDRNGNVTII